MTRLSREKKREQRDQREYQREQQHAVHPHAPAAPPVDVRVPAPGNGPAGGGAGIATVGGVRVTAAPGEEIQQTVLDHLHRIALATGRPVVATVHDDRIGYVIPLQVGPDGASSFAGEPLRLPSPRTAGDRPGEAAGERVREQGGQRAPEERGQRGEAAGEAGGDAADAGRDPAVRRDRPTHTLRQVPDPTAPEPVRDAVPTFPLHAVPEPLPLGGTTPTFPLRAVPESAAVPPAPESAAPAPPVQESAAVAVPVDPASPAPGTVLPPTGVFGPPPTMDTAPRTAPEPVRRTEPEPASGFEPGTDPDPRPTPARGFDAVAEAVLGDTPPPAPGEAPALFAEPVSRINEAVKAGRIDTATELAGRTVTEAMGVLGAEHPEVLRLRELTAYIAYLAGEPVRSFRLSVELARVRRAAHDAEAAYGNVQSAATAWRAVRDPEQGLSLGSDLIGLWTELAAEEGPAADDIEELESARARMGRLAERAERAARARDSA
jgi:hypothetical protein